MFLSFSGFNVNLPEKEFVFFDKATAVFAEQRTSTSIQIDKNVYEVLKKINNNIIEEFNEKTLKQALRLLNNLIFIHFDVEIKTFAFI